MKAPSIKEMALLDALKEAYLLILQMPHNMLRINNQAVLANARDSIAEFTSETPEKVQNDFESEAFKLRSNSHD